MFLVVLGVETRASHIRGKFSTLLTFSVLATDWGQQGDS